MDSPNFVCGIEITEASSNIVLSIAAGSEYPKVSNGFPALL